MSSSSSNTRWVYDVFLSFRGDVRRGVVSHLDAALSNAGVNTFIDDRLERGAELWPHLERVIQASQISVVVLSKNYASSRWCLNELVKIMECRTTYGQVVVPVFYDVDPSDVRKQTGDFGDALQENLRNCVPEGRLQRWKEALSSVANISGFHSTTMTSEYQLVTQIVEDIYEKLHIGLLFVAEHAVGLESRMQQVLEFIDGKSDRGSIVGIWGMGGLGKTTVAKGIYNQIRMKFRCRCFIENFRDVCGTDNRKRDFQERLLSDLLKTNVKVNSIAMGITMIKKTLCERKILIVLDDVPDFEQLKAVCGNLKQIGEESLVIITTRDVRLLNVLQAHHEVQVHICQIKKMAENESLELFSWHALKHESPKEDLIRLSRDIVTYCGGLPIALEVIGSSLFGRKKKEWEILLSKLKKIPDKNVQEKLRISYDDLDDEGKKIFLDICFFFIGKDRADVTDILKGCDFEAEIGITILIEKSLVKVEKNNKLKMHDLLRDMGREIVRRSCPEKPEKRSRLWVQQEVIDVLEDQTGTEAIEGLTLNLQETSGIHFNTKAFEKMKKFRLLQLDQVHIDGDYAFLNKKLRWFCWQGFPLKHIPDNLYLGNIISIELKYSKIRLVWKESQLLETLKILNLSHSRDLMQTPDFSKLPNLEKLILKDCTSLSRVHQSIGDLSYLTVINLMGCSSLRNLPRSIYQLTSLETLILSGSKIDKLEDDIVQMESLTTLIAKDTAIKEMPHSIVRLKSIGYISLCGHEGLARDVFPSLIWSWMSPTPNLRSCTQPFGSMSPFQISMDIHHNNLGELSPVLGEFSKHRSILVHYDSKFQLIQNLRRIMDDLCDVKHTELESTSYASQISQNAMESHLIEMGSCSQVMDMHSKRITEVVVDSSVATGTYLLVEGQVERAEGKHVIELKAEKVLHIGTVNFDKHPLSKKRIPLDTLRDYSQFRPRTTTVATVMRIRSALSFATHTFFNEHAFTEVQVPTITTTDSEGFSNMYTVTTLDQKAETEKLDTIYETEGVSLEIVKAAAKEKSNIVEHLKRTERKFGSSLKDDSKVDSSKDFFPSQTSLTVSGRLHLESYTCALGNVYSFGPRFQADRTDSPKHAAEMWMVEVEMAFSQLKDSMNCANDLFNYLCKWVLEHCSEDMKFVAKRIDNTCMNRLQQIISGTPEIMSYHEAIDVLRKAEDKKFETNFESGLVLTSEHLSYLADTIYKKPVMIYNYPKEAKPFYVRQNDDGTAAAFDLAVPKLGTIISGSQNEERLNMISSRIEELGLPREKYEWYLDLRRNGTVKNSGFTLRFDLMVQFTTGLGNVRDVIPFPRSYGKANN